MPFVSVGCLLVAMKLAEIDPVGAWPWWAVAAPLVGAIAWWRYADASGLNKRREMAKMEERKAKRRSTALETIGVGPKAEQEKREAEKSLAARQRQIEKWRASGPPTGPRYATRCWEAGMATPSSCPDSTTRGRKCPKQRLLLG